MKVKTNHILVEQYKHDDYMNVGVNINGSWEVKGSLEFMDAFLLINEYKEKYKINKVDFRLYGSENEVIYKEIRDI